MTRTYRATRWTCAPCAVGLDHWAWDDDATVPVCAACGASMVSVRAVVAKAPTVIGDACDVVIEHAICHPDGTPKRFTSKSEMRREAAARGYMNVVEHKPLPGTDKSKFTTRWATSPPPGYDPRPMALLTPDEQRERRQQVGTDE